MPLGLDVGATHNCVAACCETHLDGFFKSARPTQVLCDQVRCCIRRSLEITVQKVRDARMQALPITAKQCLIDSLTYHRVLESRAIARVSVGFGKHTLT